MFSTRQRSGLSSAFTVASLVRARLNFSQPREQMRFHSAGLADQHRYRLADSLSDLRIVEHAGKGYVAHKLLHASGALNLAHFDSQVFYRHPVEQRDACVHHPLAAERAGFEVFGFHFSSLSALSLLRSRARMRALSALQVPAIAFPTPFPTLAQRRESSILFGSRGHRSHSFIAASRTASFAAASCRSNSSTRSCSDSTIFSTR